MSVAYSSSFIIPSVSWPGIFPGRKNRFVFPRIPSTVAFVLYNVRRTSRGRKNNKASVVHLHEQGRENTLARSPWEVVECTDIGRRYLQVATYDPIKFSPSRPSVQLLPRSFHPRAVHLIGKSCHEF